MTTIHDVARLAGVSIGTVSNVLNRSSKVTPQTSERVMAAIQELNYIPNTLAKSLKTSQSRVIGILAEDTIAFSSGAIIDGICDYCENHNYTISLSNLRVNTKVEHSQEFLYKDLESTLSFKQSVHNALTTLLSSRICGLIYIGTFPRDVGDILPQLDIPVVYTYGYTHKKDYCINYDDYQGAHLAIEHLIKMGHKRIAIISGTIDSIPSHKRMMGYQAALMEHNLPFYPEYVRTGHWHFEDGYSQCQNLLHLPVPPTAIFSMSDFMAFGVIRAAMDCGLNVPGDLSVHGFDDLEASSFFMPALSTVHLPLLQIGLTAAQTLDQILCGTPPSEKNILLPCEHIERESVLKMV